MQEEINRCMNRQGSRFISCKIENKVIQQKKFNPFWFEIASNLKLNLKLWYLFAKWWSFPPASILRHQRQTQWDIFDTKIFKGKSVPLFLLAERKLPLAGGGSCFFKKSEILSHDSLNFWKKDSYKLQFH